MNSIRKSRLWAATAVVLLSLGSAQGALTLTIDPVAHTFTWSGTVTVEGVSLVSEDYVFYTVGNVLSSGGGNADTTPGALGVSLSNGQGSRFSPMGGVGDTYVAAAGKVYAELGEISPGSGTTDFTITGNGVAYSYTWDGAPQYYLNNWASLDGVELFLQRDYTSFASVGQAVVVPEPSSALLAAGAAGLLFLRRRRK